MKENLISLENISVFVAMPTHRGIEAEVITSLQGVWQECVLRNISVEFHMQDGGSDVFCCRNWALWDFLKKDHTRLFWWDSDIACKPADFFRLLAFSTELDVVAASYRMKKEPPVYCCGPQLKGGMVLKTNKFGCFKVEGLGLGFTCVTRAVIDKMLIDAPKVLIGDQVGPLLFRSELVASDRGKKDGVVEYQGEDMTFFADARKAGYEVWLDPTINLSHIGKKAFDGSFADQLLRKE